MGAVAIGLNPSDICRSFFFSSEKIIKGYKKRAMRTNPYSEECVMNVLWFFGWFLAEQSLFFNVKCGFCENLIFHGDVWDASTHPAAAETKPEHCFV